MRLPWLVLIAACGGTQQAAAPLPPDETPAGDLPGMPAVLAADNPKTGDPRAVHVRIWADAGVRALPSWKDALTDQFDAAGQLLQPLLGIRLTVDQIAEWDHTGTDVHAALADLATADAGSDVTWVIGYIAPADTATQDMAELGAGEPLGHHVVVRAWAEQPETAALAKVLPPMTPVQRIEVVAAHRRHKQAVVLLHGLAATLGAIDEEETSLIQHSIYSPKMAGFSDRNRELLQLAIDDRLGGGTDPELAQQLLAAIEANEWGGWSATSHDAVVKQLTAVVDAAKRHEAAPDVPAAAQEQYDHARDLGKQGKVGDALVILDNLQPAYPGNPALAELRCELLVKTPGVRDKRARAACAKAADAAPGDPAPHVTVGEALAAANDRAGARAELAVAAQKIPNLSSGQADAWRRLASAYFAMDALTLAEEALASGKLEGDPMAAELARDRVRYGAPKGLLKPDVEGDAVSATKLAMVLIGNDKLAEAERVIAAGERKVPRAPGLATARCNLDLERGAVEAARAACVRALASDPDNSYALYFAAILQFRSADAASTRGGIAKLEHAIQVDPDLGPAWRALGKAYDRAGDNAARAALAEKYQAKFGQPL